jgi:hypothetical protein
MPAVTRLPVLLAVVLLSLAPGPVTAQPEEPSLRVVLLSQSPFATPTRQFRIAVEVTNTGTGELANLGATLWIYHPARSRSAYAQGLEAEPPTTPLVVSPISVGGSLGPGASRSISVRRRVPELAARGESALYPVKVQVESNGLAVASLRTVLVFVDERPLVPLDVSVTFVLDAPMRMQPDGSFVDDTLERHISPQGRLETLVASVEANPIACTLAVSPLLLEQLTQMARGYRVTGQGEPRTVRPADPPARQAASLVARVRELARLPNVEVVPLPYASPPLPALVEGGLTADLEAQLQLGARTLEERLGIPPTASLLRPPASDVTPRTVEALKDLEIDGLILDADAAPPPPGLILTPSSVASLRAGPDRSMLAVAPDPAVEARLDGAADDPRLRTQQVIGELSAMYLEQPSVDRGVALIVGEDDNPDPGFLGPLVRALARTPPPVRWLRPVTVTRLLVGGEEAPAQRRVADGRSPTYPEGVRVGLTVARRSISELTSISASQSALPSRLQRLLLTSESRWLLGHEDRAVAYLDTVTEQVRTELQKVEPPAFTSVTLTSQRGVIPVTLRNLLGYEARVRVTLSSARLEFLGGGSREVTLTRPVQAFTFPVRAQTTGRFPVRILVQTPAGTEIGSSRIVVRSTAYNRVALLVTIGAALFLALWWGRRFLPRAGP